MKYKGLLVIALCGMACSDFIEEPITDKKIELLSPGHDAESAAYDVHFMWSELTHANLYRLQIASPDFGKANLFYADTLIDGTTFTISLEPGTYCWRVKGTNGSSETAYTRRCFKVYESDFTNQTVLLNTPATQYLSANHEITFTWHDVFRSTQYRLQVDTNNFTDTEKMVFDGTVTDKKFHLSELKEQQYQWRVRAIYGEQETRWSEVRIFKLDQSPPEKPILLSPQNNLLVQLPVDLIWEEVKDIDYYELFLYQADSTTLYNNQYPAILQGTNHRFTGGETPGKVLWRVRAYDNAGNRSEFSKYRSIITSN